MSCKAGIIFYRKTHLLDKTNPILNVHELCLMVSKMYHVDIQTRIPHYGWFYAFQATDAKLRLNKNRDVKTCNFHEHFSVFFSNSQVKGIKGRRYVNRRNRIQFVVRFVFVAIDVGLH
jgi:hypothetical protein